MRIPEKLALKFFKLQFKKKIGFIPDFLLLLKTGQIKVFTPSTFGFPTIRVLLIYILKYAEQKSLFVSCHFVAAFLKEAHLAVNFVPNTSLKMFTVDL